MKHVAEIFSPGEFLREELETRGWSQVELAEIIGRPARLINEIIAEKRAITPETAIQLGNALGTGPELWMIIEGQYQLSKAKVSGSEVISRKAKLYEKFPVREMIKRGWVQAADGIDTLEQQFLDFFEIPSLDSAPSLSHAAKKSTYNDVSISQWAWLIRAKEIARTQVSKKYKKENLISAIEQLRQLLSAPEEARHVCRILNEAGVRFVLVEALPGSKIDGACIWLDKNSPVIAMSTRMDRIDNFWFVLRHEIEHVLHEHGKNNHFKIDDDIFSVEHESILDEERVANAAAADFCVSRKELENYILRTTPYCFSTTKVVGFSSRIGVHPGLVVGQLQRHFSQYKYLRDQLVKIRQIVIQSTPSDGWGDIYPI